MIDQFTKEEFEAYLETNHSPYRSLGLVDGEHQYNVILDNQVSITVRSSIKADGLSANVGKDSIRCWLISAKDGSNLGSKVSKWTTRQPGWQERLTSNIKQLLEWRILAGDCPECGKPKGIFKVRKAGENKGRPFAKCKVHNHFAWLDKDISEDNHGSNTGNNQKQVAHTTKGTIDKSISSEGTLRYDDNSSVLRNAEERNKIVNDLQELPTGPNPAQQTAIEADLTQDTRILAGPGSGKTYVIERRYKYLVDNGVNPNNILVCTFSKDMAGEMGKRILATCPVANVEQISTIHAFCYRILARWYPESRYYRWNMPKDWEVKSQLEDLIGLIWKGKEKPNAQEVFDVINTTKYLGLTADDSYEHLVNGFGQQYGGWLYNIRCRFDAWLLKNRFVTFADMLYLVEKQLQTDEKFRTKLQSRFSQVIIDEGQDTSAQAIRILVTVSLKPGQNTVYEVIK